MPTGCSVLNPAGCVASAAKAVAADAFGAIAQSFGHAAQAVIGWLWSQLSSATAVHLGGAGFHTDLAIVAAITGTVAVGLFVVQLVSSTLRRDSGGLARAGKGLVVAFIAGGVAVAVTNAALGAVDALSSGIVQTAMGTDIAGMGRKLLDGTAIMSVANPAALLLVSMAAIAAVVIVWFALMVRKVLIVVSAVFAPLAFAGSLADITVSWTRRWIEVMAALVVSKLVLVVVFVVGWGVLDGGGLAGSGVGQGLTQTAAGLLILAVAGLAPWMALKLVHFTGEQFHHLHALAGSAAGGAATVAAAPQKVAAWRSTAASLGASSLGRGVSGANGSDGSTGHGRQPGEQGGAESGGASSGARAGPGDGGSGASGGKALTTTTTGGGPSERAVGPSPTAADAGLRRPAATPGERVPPAALPTRPEPPRRAEQ